MRSNNTHQPTGTREGEVDVHETGGYPRSMSVLHRNLSAVHVPFPANWRNSTVGFVVLFPCSRPKKAGMCVTCSNARNSSGKTHPRNVAR